MKMETCPSCQVEFDSETPDRKQTGSCWDDEYYCDQCIDSGKCGCARMVKENRELLGVGKGEEE